VLKHDISYLYYAHALFLLIPLSLTFLFGKRLLASLQVLQQSQARIKTQNEELRQLNELKNHFVGMAAHDLRGPLGQIRLAAGLSLLEEGSSREEERGYLQMIHRLSEHMISLVSNILDITLIESGRLDLNKSEFDFAKFIREAVDDHRRIAARKKITIEVSEIPAESILADTTRVRQVLDNLISNAVKFSPPNSRVEVGGEVTAQCCRIFVRDEGPGLSAEDQANLFKDFRRLSARPSGGEKSTGLGLAIAKRIVTAHGGEIGAETTPGKGSMFWFTLPRSEQAPLGIVQAPAQS
jgi:hypothetical protein